MKPQAYESCRRAGKRRWRGVSRVYSAALVTGISLVLAVVACTQADAQAPSPRSEEVLGNHIAVQARSWEAHTTPGGQVIDPLDAADSGDGYGVILLADVMLRVAARENDPVLAETGERIVLRAETLPTVTGPFNLLAIAVLLRDGERSYLPSAVWSRISSSVAALARRVGPEGAHDCLTTAGCYNNWRLVWSAGASALLASQAFPGAAVATGNADAVAGEIAANLRLAAAHVGTRISGSASGGAARELSDPGSEPQAYEMFSAVMLELIGEEDPSAMTPAMSRLRDEVDRYALLMMAPDGQLSFSGRSLDESWVQAAGVDLGLRRAAGGSAYAPEWRSFASRASGYLMSTYPTLSDGLGATVPGLAMEWNRSLVDSYAAFAQYSGLTLWLLSDALAHSSSSSGAGASLPTDRSSFLLGDVRTSGTVWGRAQGVWWELRGRATGEDPRLAQGLVAVKIRAPDGWRDLLALRPRRYGLSSTWSLTTAAGRTARPTFARVQGNGARAVLRGYYEGADGRRIARVTWTVTATGAGVTLVMTRPRGSELRTTIWVTDGAPHVATEATVKRHHCVVTASGSACPETLLWSQGRAELHLR